MVAFVRLSLPIVALIFWTSTGTPAGAARYAVEGLSLGDPIDTGSPNYRSYNCQPSEDFIGITWCSRTQQRNIRGRNVTVTNRIGYAADRTALYLSANVKPVMQTRTAIQAEINRLSREIGAQPAKVEWEPKYQSADLPTAVLAIWGNVTIELLRGDALREIEGGTSLKRGVLVDMLGDERSITEDYPVYRVVGGNGYIHAASFEANGRGHRFDMAVNGGQMTARNYEMTLRQIIKRDQALPANDLQLWPEVAVATRRFALDTSAATANQLLARVFTGAGSTKLQSRVWSILPGGAIEHMAMQQFGTVDIYGPKTEHPVIRQTIQQFLKANPSEPFADLLHYVVGDFEKALQTNPNSPLSDVFHYAAGYTLIEGLAREAIKILDPTVDDDQVALGAVSYLNYNPELYKDKLIGAVVPNFAARAAAARAHFRAVLRNGTARHADDAAYMLGWLDLHQGNVKEAMAYFGQAMVLGNEDYKWAAQRRMVLVLGRYPPREQVSMVEADRNLARQPVLWYVAARAAYRELDHALAIDAVERALKALKVPLDRLPATTDPKVIDNAIEKINPELSNDYNMSEIPYLLEASREIVSYRDSLKAVAGERPEEFSRRSRKLIIKYSNLVDEQAQQSGQPRPKTDELAHRDLRQASHMIDATLAAVPKTAEFSKLREWLRYRKIRVSVAFAPTGVGAAVAAMEQEFPTSDLLDDVMAEQIFTQGLVQRDVAEAQATFRKLLEKFPRGNAIDNAYTWMAIIYRCEGRTQDAQNMNRDIIRRFPNSRHAVYARKRMTEPEGCGMEN